MEWYIGLLIFYAVMRFPQQFGTNQMAFLGQLGCDKFKQSKYYENTT